MHMNWKRYRDAVREGRGTGGDDEDVFVLGLDLGNDTSSIAYFNISDNEAQLLDTSGGYGKPSVPSVMQYITQSREWVFGEYAIQNASAPGTVLVRGLVERLGRREYVDVEGRPMAVSALLGLFIRELVAQVRNINPKGEVVGIVASISGYMSEEAQAELLQAFTRAGLTRELIGFASEAECVLQKYIHGAHGASMSGEMRIAMVDMGGRAMRTAAMEVAECTDNSLKLRCVSVLFEERLGVDAVRSLVDSMLLRFYEEEQGEAGQATKKQLYAFVHQHADILWGKLQRPARFYFNFVHPAFVRSVGRQNVDAMLHDTRMRMRHFIARFVGSTSGRFGALLMYGGGFEMPWARELVQEGIGLSPIAFRNAKATVAEGAAIAAARQLGLLDPFRIEIEDRNRMDMDIGVCILQGGRERFLPLVEHGSFWWQKRRPLQLMLGEASGMERVRIPILRRDAAGDVSEISVITIDDLPPRPPGTTRLALSALFPTSGRLQIHLRDQGFGEIFPATGKEATAEIMV